MPALKQLLNETGYDKHKAQYLLDGFENGFDIGYRGKADVKLTAPNLKLKGPEEKLVLWNKVMKEVKVKRYAGPYEIIPFDYYIQLPIGLVLKDNGRDTRRIFHLSYPRGRGLSLNQNTLAHMCYVTYPDFNKVVELFQLASKSCKMGKS